MRVLVTGAAGFIGSSLVDRLLSLGHQVLGLDNFNDFYDPEVKRRNLRAAQQSPAFECVVGDVCDGPLLAGLFARFAPERVVHLAAWAGVRPSIERPLVYQQANLEGTVRLLEQCRASGVQHFVFASSSSVYGDRQSVPFSEADAVDEPISPYAATKRAGELLCYTWHHLFQMNIHCLRFFTVYGPRQRPDLAIHKFARAIDQGRPITVFGDGSTSRDYTYIDDIIDGVVASIERVQGYRIYNLGEATPVSLSELVDAVGNAIGKTPLIERAPLQPGDVSRTYANIERARAELGYAPHTALEDGLARFVAWMRSEG